MSSWSENPKNCLMELDVGAGPVTRRVSETVASHRGLTPMMTMMAAMTSMRKPGQRNRRRRRRRNEEDDDDNDGDGDGDDDDGDDAMVASEC